MLSEGGLHVNRMADTVIKDTSGSASSGGCRKNWLFAGRKYWLSEQCWDMSRFFKIKQGDDDIVCF